MTDYISGNRYLSKDEMTINAQFIMDYLISREEGWTKESISAMLGNMESESTINPGIWESLKEGNMAGGFGLVQWTPASKLIDWANKLGYVYDRIETQLERIVFEIENDIQWISTSKYPMTFKQFIKSTESPDYLADVFLTNYERPKEPNQPIRGIQALYWYENLEGDGNYIPDKNKVDPFYLISNKRKIFRRR